MSDVTQILSQIEAGDSSAAEQLLPLVYDQLRKLAASRLAQEKPGHTLQATALVHEAYMRLVDVDTVQHWNNRGHFFGACAEAMRRILVERARLKCGPTRGGRHHRVDLDQAQSMPDQRSEEIVAVSEALSLLAEDSPIPAELVKLRYFAGFSLEEAAEIMGLSRATAYRYWAYAKAFLLKSLKEAKDS